MFDAKGAYGFLYRICDFTDIDHTMDRGDLRFTKLSDVEKLIKICKFKHWDIIKLKDNDYWNYDSISASPAVLEYKENARIKTEKEEAIKQALLAKINSLPTEFHLFPDIIDGVHVWITREKDYQPNTYPIPCRVMYTLCLPLCETEPSFKLARTLELATNKNYKEISIHIDSFVTADNKILVASFLGLGGNWCKHDDLAAKFNGDKKLAKALIRYVYDWSKKVTAHIRCVIIN